MEVRDLQFGMRMTLTLRAVYPVSAVLANKDVMLCIQPGEHGSTYGGYVIQLYGPEYRSYR